MTQRKWILLAEDNRFDADLAIRALTDDQFPWDVLVTKDGQEALDCLNHRANFDAAPAGHPAVVLLDLKMPQMDGLEVLQQIKADAQLRIIPVVVFTSSREEADVAHCYPLGANAYVVKPVDLRQFGAVLKAIKAFWMVVNESPPRHLRLESPGASRSAAAARSPFHALNLSQGP